MHALLAFTQDDHWEPGIGDPTVIGWVTVVAYFVAAWLCWSCTHRYGKAGSGWSRPRVFWALVTLALVFLGFNKQLDLQTWLTLFGKHLAQNEGWYDQRRTYQAAFIGGVAVGGAFSLVGLRALVGRVTPPVRLALIGGVFLGCFILIRASSFHHVDQMLGMNFEGIKMNWVLELGSITLVAAAAAWELRRLRRPVLPSRL
jgi:hypothetical protein